jgi:hypothetical protein
VISAAEDISQSNFVLAFFSGIIAKLAIAWLAAVNQVIKI